MIMMVSTMFSDQMFKFINLFTFNFVMPVFLDYVDKLNACKKVIF